MRDDRLITLSSFLEAFARQHVDRPDRPFCFVLGAGASVQSGIPTGADMVREWLEMMHRAEDFEGLSLEQWATAETLGIEGFDGAQPGRFYPQVYARCFREREEDGHAYLEKQVEGKAPSFGYAVLASILATTPHRILITTNFDDLAAEAVAVHADTFPKVVPLESLGDYARVALRRPVIAKVHGGLGFARRPSSGELAGPPSADVRALDALLDRFTPVVIGYEGNDGSLLESLEHLGERSSRTIFWCFHDPGRQPTQALGSVPERVRAFIQARKGRLVPIPGFDELMLLLHHRLSGVGTAPGLLERLQQRSTELVRRFDVLQRTLAERCTAPATAGETAVTLLLTTAARRLIPREGPPPPGDTPPEPPAVSPEFVSPPVAEAQAQRAAQLGDEALQLAQAGRVEDADAAFRRALEAVPEHAGNCGNYALFLAQAGRALDAESWFQRALALDADHANNLGNYAVLLKNLGRHKEANTLYQRALAADPANADHLGNYAVYLADRECHEQAGEFFVRALAADPAHAGNLGNYARYLAACGRVPEALDYFERVLRADPADADNRIEHLELLFATGARADAQARLIESEAQETGRPELGLALNFYRLAHFPEASSGALGRLRSLLAAGVRAPDWDPEPTLRHARRSGHSRLPLLQTLAHVITGRMDATELDRLPEGLDTATLS